MPPKHVSVCAPLCVAPVWDAEGHIQAVQAAVRDGRLPAADPGHGRHIRAGGVAHHAHVDLEGGEEPGEYLKKMPLTPKP